MTNNARPLHFSRPDRPKQMTANPASDSSSGGTYADTGGSEGLDPSRNKPANVADQYEDLLRPLSRQARRGMVVQLTRGFYDGWRPSRRELADVVAVELGILGVDESLERQRMRRAGREPPEDILTRVLNYSRRT